ncbi:MAG: hypothetical protein B6U89_04055 [Desulfurococcales archaeon ex4484_58]|nr:MAG: hypothetical protein B6U89_04055 [Desulfurococcales archaeon ex4484_58]
MNEYAFPEVFVENIESDKYVLELDENTYVLVKKRENYSYRRFFGHIIYEHILEYINLTKPLIERSFIVIKKYTGGEMNGMLIEKNITPCLAEVSGIYPYILVSEGEKISNKDKIAYIITNKGEIRTIKSPCDGFIALIINITWEKPEKYILVVVKENEFRRITIREVT